MGLIQNNTKGGDIFAQLNILKNTTGLNMGPFSS